MSTGVGSVLDEVKERIVYSVKSPTAQVEQRLIQLHEGWKGRLMNAEHSELWQEALLHERFSTSEEGHSSITFS